MASFNPDHFKQAQDGSELKIADILVFEPAGAKDPSLVISKDATYTVKVYLEYTEILGDVGATVDIKLCVNDICSGASHQPYEKSVVLDKDTTEKVVEFSPLPASVKGIFKIHCGAVVVASEVAAYMEGPVLFIIEG